MKTYALQALRQIEASASKSLWNAHWGCAVLAGVFLVEENLIDVEAKAEVRALLDRLVAAHGDFRTDINEGGAKMTRMLFAEKLTCVLAEQAQEPKELGHDVIFSAYVLKTLEYFQIDPWPSLLDNLTLLVRTIKASGSGWITINGKNEVRQLKAVESKTAENYWVSFARFERPLQMEAGDMQLGHLLTHGHAIQMMEGRANQELVDDFDVAYRKRLYGLRQANREEKDRTPLSSRKQDPRAKEYWRSAESLERMHHLLKYAYSFLDLNRDQLSEADLEAFGRIILRPA